MNIEPCLRRSAIRWLTSCSISSIRAGPRKLERSHSMTTTWPRRQVGCRENAAIDRNELSCPRSFRHVSGALLFRQFALALDARSERRHQVDDILAQLAA
jgi:hypothetical protein